MRVLVAFPNDSQSNLHLYHAVQHLGHEAFALDVRKHPEQLVNECDKNQIKLVICSRTISLLNQIKYLREHRKNILIACVQVDKRSDVRQFGTLLELFDNCHFFYTMAQGNVAQYKALCPNTNVQWLSQGCDPDIHKIEELTAEDHAKYDCDVMFAGTIDPVHGNRYEILSYVTQKCKKNGLVFHYHSVQGGNSLFDSEHNKACRCAKVCLSHNGWANIKLSMSVRVYKIIAAGGLLLEEDCEDCKHWLNDKCFTYTSKEDCWEKIQELVAWPEDKRLAYTKEASEYVREYHPYSVRVSRIINDARHFGDK